MKTQRYSLRHTYRLMRSATTKNISKKSAQLTRDICEELVLRIALRAEIVSYDRKRAKRTIMAEDVIHVLDAKLFDDVYITSLDQYARNYDTTLNRLKNPSGLSWKQKRRAKRHPILAGTAKSSY